MGSGRGNRVTRFRPGFLGGPKFNGVSFSSGDYLTRSSALTGVVDADAAMGSFWYRSTRDGSYEPIFTGIGNSFIIAKNASNVLRFQISSGIFLDMTGGTITVADGWKHILWAFDISAALALIYVDDVDVTSVSTIAGGGNGDFTASTWYQGRNAALFGEFDIGQFWMKLGSALDISVEANRRKFVSSGVTPKTLGADGSNPGLTPEVFFHGNASAYLANRGTGGDFTLTGTLATVQFP